MVRQTILLVLNELSLIEQLLLVLLFKELSVCFLDPLLLAIALEAVRVFNIVFLHQLLP